MSLKTWMQQLFCSHLYIPIAEDSTKGFWLCICRKCGRQEWVMKS